MEGLRRGFVVAISVVTLFLLGGIGVSAASGHLGSAQAGHDLMNLISHEATPGHHAKCKGDNDEHHNATRGHENGCDNEGGHGGRGGG